MNKKAEQIYDLLIKARDQGEDSLTEIAEFLADQMPNQKVNIELNGIANLLILLDMAEGGFGSEMPDDEQIKAFEQLPTQIELLERYMLAFTDAINKQEQPPYWHEVRDNPSKYPRNNDR